MPKICYEKPPWMARAIDEDGEVDLGRLPPKSQSKVAVIAQANEILADYNAQGYELTLRQLYYQFVARDLIPNSQREYKRLGDAVNDGRMWGMIDWSHIVDRGRNLVGHGHWDDASQIIHGCARGFRLDLWEESPIRPEVWVEKQALEQVVGRPAGRWDVDYLACKGYMSQSEMWSTSQRIIRHYRETGQATLVIHLGDHDPSGIDMSRDIEERLRTFRVTPSAFEVRRVALNMDQVDQYQPPPNPAKMTDSRFKDYMAKFGTESWELDALEPAMLDSLIEEHIRSVVDDSFYQRREEQDRIRAQITAVADRWDEVEDFIADTE